ncbi:hypothetical protein G6011_09918 [Alternaria panax]|uniref:SET domain-containing protein n=1 Tax=Alternaria panax TaxID=48097 RepID=A0AAD4I2T4_9PLEO|nr:hypothetical protein G6011_09918 [Alternaria panax]
MRNLPAFLAHLLSVDLLPWTLQRQQCWQESPLYTLTFQTSLDGLRTSAFCLEPFSPFGAVQAKPHDIYAPWSHIPVCTPHLPGINDTLCVYTDETFARGRGMSIVTTPRLAREFAVLPAFLDDALLAARSVNIPTDVYRATNIPGKGVGMLAARQLMFGNTVTSHTPAFIAYLESELSTLDREALWRVAIGQLPRPLQESFLSLATVYGDERVRVQDIVKANTFQLEVGGVNHLAVWPETSRLNHACAPNAQYVVDTESLTHTVRVTRPIARDEEITISYTRPLEETAERQRHMQQGFHFVCSCARCTDQGSDAVLRRIESLEAELNDWSLTSLGSTAMAEELLVLYREEGLEGFMDMAYGFVALAYSAVGDRKKALEYANKAQEAVEMKDGTWTTNWKVWEEFRRNVEGHWSWRRRV